VYSACVCSPGSGVGRLGSKTVIKITEDKLRLALLEYLGKVESKNRWQVPLGVIAGLVPILLTSDFKEVLGVSKDTWQGVFSFFVITAVGWFVWTLRHVKSSVSIDALVERIKRPGRDDASQETPSK
jgi:hypothetical protein